MTEFMEVVKFGALILGGGYFIWKIETQGKLNKALIERLDEKHSLFFEKFKEVFEKEIEALDSKIKTKKQKIEDMERKIEGKYIEVKKELDLMKEGCNSKHNECQVRMNNFLDIRSADEKYVSKMELRLELQKIDSKLDTLISYFKGRGGDGLPKIN